MNFKHEFSTSYRHQTVGTIERNLGVLSAYLKSYLLESGLKTSLILHNGKGEQKKNHSFFLFFRFLYHGSANTLMYFVPKSKATRLITSTHQNVCLFKMLMMIFLCHKIDAVVSFTEDSLSFARRFGFRKKGIFCVICSLSLSVMKSRFFARKISVTGMGISVSFVRRAAEKHFF